MEPLRYPSIRRKTYKVPWGYDPHPDDPEILIADEEAMDALEQARVYLRDSSFREVANWLTAVTERPITHAGLMVRLKFDPEKDNTAPCFKFK
jgi:hypothetical protein